MVNFESRPDTPAGTMKIGVRQRRTAQIIAWEFIPWREGNVSKPEDSSRKANAIASGMNVERNDNILEANSFVAFVLYLVPPWFYILSGNCIPSRPMAARSTCEVKSASTTRKSRLARFSSFKME